jgi:hypothetical protein
MVGLVADRLFLVKKWAEGNPLPTIPLTRGADLRAWLRLTPTRFRRLKLSLVLGLPDKRHIRTSHRLS